MMECDYLISGDYLVAMDSMGSVLEEAAVAVRDGMVLETGLYCDLSAKYKPLKKLGGQGRAIIPGLVNAHTHSPMVLMRGMADDMPLMEWLEKHIWPAENKWLSEEFVRDAARLACLEMIRSGTTAFCDMYFFEGVVADVASELGLRSVLTAGVIDFPTHTTKGPDDCLDKAMANIDKFKGNELVLPGIGLHAPYTCGPETIAKAVAMAKAHDVLLSIHLSETEWEVGEVRGRHGNTPAMYLDTLGFFEARTLSSHCVWLTPEEIDLMAQRGASIAHCPESNLKLASGIAPVPEMLKAGINVSLGTDGAASNNDLDMFGEMATAAKLHKAVCMDPSALDAATAMGLVTTNGAKALGLDGSGSIVPGAKADIVILDMRKPHLTPVYNIYSHLAYSVRASDVESVMVGGRVLLDGGELVCADEGDILDRAAAWGARIKKDRLS